MKECKYCQTKFQFGIDFYSIDCCLRCHNEGRDWKPEQKRERIGRWSGGSNRFKGGYERF